MNGNFRKLLEAGDIVPARNADEELFILEGQQYYEFKDGGVPTRPLRFHAYAECSFEHDAWRMDRESLLAYLNMYRDFVTDVMVQAGNAELIRKKCTEMLSLTHNVLQRVEGYSDVEFVYDMAAIWYFTEDEDPTTFDRAEAVRKKSIWRHYPELYAFFLSMDLGRYIPLQRLSQPDSLTLAAARVSEQLIQLQRASQQSALLGMTSDTKNFIDLLTETQSEYASLLVYLLRNITATSQRTGKM